MPSRTYSTETAACLCFLFLLILGIACLVAGSVVASSWSSNPAQQAQMDSASVGLIISGVVLIVLSVFCGVCGSVMAASTETARALGDVRALQQQQQQRQQQLLSATQGGVYFWRDANGSVVTSVGGAPPIVVVGNRVATPWTGSGVGLGAGSVININGVDYVVGGGPPVAAAAGGGPAPFAGVPLAVEVPGADVVSVGVGGAAAAAGQPPRVGNSARSGPAWVSAAAPAGKPGLEPPPPAVGAPLASSAAAAPDFAVRQQRDLELTVDQGNLALDEAIAKAADFDFSFDKGYDDAPSAPSAAADESGKDKQVGLV